MSNTAREFSHAAKLLLLLQKFRGETLHQSLWGEIRGRRSCRSHSELWKHKIVVEVRTLVSFPQKFVDRVACTMLFCTMEYTLKHLKWTYRKRQKFHLRQANDHFSSFFSVV